MKGLKKERSAQRDSRRSRREPKITYENAGFTFDRSREKLRMSFHRKERLSSVRGMSKRKFFLDDSGFLYFKVKLSRGQDPKEVIVDVCGVGYCRVKNGEWAPADRFFISPLGVVYPTCFDCLNKTRLHRTDRKFSNAATSMSFEEFSEVLSKDLPEGSEKIQVVSELDEEPWVRGVKKEGEYFVLTAQHLLNAVATAAISLLLLGLFVQFMF